jgi:hypothetical protein
VSVSEDFDYGHAGGLPNSLFMNNTKTRRHVSLNSMYVRLCTHALTIVRVHTQEPKKPISEWGVIVDRIGPVFLRCFAAAAPHLQQFILDSLHY